MDDEENYPDEYARVFLLLNDEILLVFDFELGAQGKTALNWFLRTEQWRALWIFLKMRPFRCEYSNP